MLKITYDVHSLRLHLVPIYDISAKHNRRRSESVQVKIGADMNEPTLLYSALIKEKIRVRS